MDMVIIMSNLTVTSTEKAEKVAKVLAPTVVSVDKVVAIEVDASSLTFEALKSIPANDKGNRTVLYSKWIDESTGITMQLTGYVTGTSFSAQEEGYKQAEIDRLNKEARELKSQMAQFQTLMANPEMQQLMAKLAKGE
jgi:hypothetical protein